jgi:hypothetical protein
MAVEERRRVALHRHAAETWGEEAADTWPAIASEPGHTPTRVASQR